MNASLMWRMKELEDENRRVNKNVCGQTFKTQNYSGSHGKKVLNPSQCREIAMAAVTHK